MNENIIKWTSCCDLEDDDINLFVNSGNLFNNMFGGSLLQLEVEEVERYKDELTEETYEFLKEKTDEGITLFIVN